MIQLDWRGLVYRLPIPDALNVCLSASVRPFFDNPVRIPKLEAQQLVASPLGHDESLLMTSNPALRTIPSSDKMCQEGSSERMAAGQSMIAADLTSPDKNTMGN